PLTKPIERIRIGKQLMTEADLIIKGDDALSKTEGAELIGELIGYYASGVFDPLDQWSKRSLPCADYRFGLAGERWYSHIGGGIGAQVPDQYVQFFDQALVIFLALAGHDAIGQESCIRKWRLIRNESFVFGSGDLESQIEQLLPCTKDQYLLGQRIFSK